LPVDFIELYPDLVHCIETVAREKYWNLASELMEDDGKKVELPGKVELMREFLQSAEFSLLRRESEKYLMSGRKVKFTVYWEGASPDCTMKVI